VQQPIASIGRGLWLAVSLLGVFICLSAVLPGSDQPYLTLSHRPLAPAELRANAERWLDRSVQLVAGDQSFRVRRRALGISLGIPTGTWVPGPEGWQILVDQELLREQLTQLKTRVDRAPSPAQVDIRKRILIRHEDGQALAPEEALNAVTVALVSGKETLTVPLRVTPVPASARAPKGLSFAVIKGQHQTKFAGGGKNWTRARNIYVASGRVGAIVIDPGSVFSFNSRVGPRSSRNGFRKAKGIRMGELVEDDMGGGVCQVASTIHAAAVFAGMEILEARPHSRPSTYIHMGLDATVSYPVYDLKLRNPYPYAVALQVTADKGRLNAEFLGAKRPFSTTFTRRIVSRIRYGTKSVSDPAIPLGTRVVSQEGGAGYRIKRTIVITGGARAGTYRDTLYYPPTYRIMRIGTGQKRPHSKPVIVASAARHRYQQTHLEIVQ
jgi:vancomycin resistance protein YoaR